MSLLSVGMLTTDRTLAERLRSFIEAEGDHAVLYQSRQTLLADAPSAICDLIFIDTPRDAQPAHLGLPHILEQYRHDRVVLITEAGDAEARAYARSLGLRSVLTKPVLSQDIQRLLFSVQAPVQHDHLNETPRAPEAIVEDLPGGRFFLADSPAMHDLYRNIRLLAPVDVPVLILGESGVGKEIVSHLLHKYSSRARREITDVNCAALPSDLLESELFGYEVGAFTGALKAKPGKFEMAHKGTLLLDEIGEMSAPMQAKLLHVLQDGHFSRLGARVSSRVDVRVLAATNIDMEEAIADRRFREDLFYRLNAFSIKVPPLRERREEIPALMAEMARRGAQTLNMPPLEPSAALVAMAQEYFWPGNVRELRNFITRLLVLRDEKSAMVDIQQKLRTRSAPPASTLSAESPAPSSDDMRTVVRGVRDQTEIRLIRDALRDRGWNRRRAAEDLQISYRALLYKIQQYGLREDRTPLPATSVNPRPVIHSHRVPVRHHALSLT